MYKTRNGKQSTVRKELTGKNIHFEAVPKNSQRLSGGDVAHWAVIDEPQHGYIAHPEGAEVTSGRSGILKMTKLCCFNQGNPHFSAFPAPKWDSET